MKREEAKQPPATQRLMPCFPAIFHFCRDSAAPYGMGGGERENRRGRSRRCHAACPPQLRNCLEFSACWRWGKRASKQASRRAAGPGGPPRARRGHLDEREEVPSSITNCLCRVGCVTGGIQLRCANVLGVNSTAPIWQHCPLLRPQKGIPCLTD